MAGGGGGAGGAGGGGGNNNTTTTTGSGLEVSHRNGGGGGAVSVAGQPTPQGAPGGATYYDYTGGAGGGHVGGAGGPAAFHPRHHHHHHLHDHNPHHQAAANMGNSPLLRDAYTGRSGQHFSARRRRQLRAQKILKKKQKDKNPRRDRIGREKKKMIFNYCSGADEWVRDLSAESFSRSSCSSLRDFFFKFSFIVSGREFEEIHQLFPPPEE